MPRRTEADLALAVQPGAGIDRVVGGGRLGEAQILQCASDIGGLAAPAAGVEDVDFGVAQFGGCDIGHVRPRHLFTKVGRC